MSYRLENSPDNELCIEKIERKFKEIMPPEIKSSPRVCL